MPALNDFELIRVLGKGCAGRVSRGGDLWLRLGTACKAYGYFPGDGDEGDLEACGAGER